MGALHPLKLAMIYLSPEAFQEINRMMAASRQPESRTFRIGIQAGGCSDYSYILLPFPTITPSDHIWDWEDLRIVVADDDLPLVDGLTLDYAQDLMGGGFRFHNPHAVSSCGCGTSFAVTSDPHSA